MHSIVILIIGSYCFIILAVELKRHVFSSKGSFKMLRLPACIQTPDVIFKGNITSMDRFAIQLLDTQIVRKHTNKSICVCVSDESVRNKIECEMTVLEKHSLRLN